MTPAEIAADQTPRNCMRCDEPTKRWLCDRCAAEEIEDREAEEDSGPEFAFDCGLLPDGTCMLAGTEDCDWECPYNA